MYLAFPLTRSTLLSHTSQPVVRSSIYVYIYSYFPIFPYPVILVPVVLGPPSSAPGEISNFDVLTLRHFARLSPAYWLRLAT